MSSSGTPTPPPARTTAAYSGNAATRDDAHRPARPAGRAFAAAARHRHSDQSARRVSVAYVSPECDTEYDDGDNNSGHGWAATADGYRSAQLDPPETLLLEKERRAERMLELRVHLSSSSDSLAQLAQLRREGMLSDAEFTHAKQHALQQAGGGAWQLRRGPATAAAAAATKKQAASDTVAGAIHGVTRLQHQSFDATKPWVEEWKMDGDGDKKRDGGFEGLVLELAQTLREKGLAFTADAVFPEPAKPSSRWRTAAMPPPGTTRTAQRVRQAGRLLRLRDTLCRIESMTEFIEDEGRQQAGGGAWQLRRGPAVAAHCKAAATEVDNQRRTSSPPLTEEEQYNAAPSSCWSESTTNFRGGWLGTIKKEKQVHRPIAEGLAKFRANPGRYIAIVYQANMVDGPEDQQKYQLVRRAETTGLRPHNVAPDGHWTTHINEYHRLPQLDDATVSKSKDQYTDAFSYKGKSLPTIFPGRGQGVGDTINLKIIGDVDPNDIAQQDVGDCWLLSAISALAEFDGAIKHLFRKTKGLEDMPRDGPNSYTITLYDLDTWEPVDIIVDERLCATDDGNMLRFARPSKDGELWVCYLEKALAAHCGGWDEIDGGQPTHGWALMTGCKEQYSIEKRGSTFKCISKFGNLLDNHSLDCKATNGPHSCNREWPTNWPALGGGGEKHLELDLDAVFARMVAWDQANFVMAGGTCNSDATAHKTKTSDAQKTDGMVDGHAYAVLRCVPDVAGSGVDLIQVRNPWGRGEFESGRWDDDGPGWDKHPEVKAALNPVLDCNDGKFWMSKEEFWRYFGRVYLCAKSMTNFIEDENHPSRAGLPAGWLAAVDPTSGRKCYYNEVTRETTSTKPQEWDPAKWRFQSHIFSGRYKYSGEILQERGLVSDGVAKLLKKPQEYVAILYLTDMVGRPEEQQFYTLISRAGTAGIKLTGVAPDGLMTIMLAEYERLPSIEDYGAAVDGFTDDMSYQGYGLNQPENPPLAPGRGVGVCDMPALKIIGDIDPNDVCQGFVGDCWLLSAISALAEFDGAVKRLFAKTPGIEHMPREEPNMYTITLYELSTFEQVDVVIDERLAAKADGSGLLGCSPSADGELWPCYLEKAVAVHCGGWDKIKGGCCTHAWAMLTGCKEQYTIRSAAADGSSGYKCYGAFNPRENKWETLANSPHEGFNGLWPMAWPEVGGGGEMDLALNQDELFERLCAWDKTNYIIGVGTKAGSDMVDGIVDGHAYTVLTCVSKVAGTDFDLAKVRNPWGRGEFQSGMWDDDGPGWKAYPRVKKELKPKLGVDDGIFWVSKEEFFTYFHTVYLSASDMTKFKED